MTRKTYNTAKYGVPTPEFSQAVQAAKPGTMLFVSGLLAKQHGASGKPVWYEDESTVDAEGDIEAQTRQILESLSHILARAGGTLDDVVRIVIYLVDMDHYPLVHKVRSECFGNEPPASTCVQVSRLYDLRQLIEIEATAIIPG